MRVLTWNLWWKFGSWSQRQPAIEAEIRRADADIVTLQEVWADDDDGDQARLLAEELGFHAIRSRRSDGSPQRFGNAILSRRPLRFVEQVTLPDLDGGPTSRTALIVAIDWEPAPRLLVTTHLTWQYHASATRQMQLQAIVDAIERHRRPDDGGEPIPVVITGDLNGAPESQELRRLTGLEPGYHPELIFIDAWAAVGEGTGYTWTRDNPHAADASWPRRRLDYVLVSWPRAKPFCSPVSARLGGTKPVSVDGRPAIVPSDHYAVIVELDDRIEDARPQ
ncbi:MAG: endonuclease/exonuclease/phosphatase family protein [Acidimicrobiia bacterium]|nr:endonuclease/exonuclease/phosphatase family protein [Acidimicrobiia bacterium]